VTSSWKINQAFDKVPKFARSKAYFMVTGRHGVNDDFTYAQMDVYYDRIETRSECDLRLKAEERNHLQKEASERKEFKRLQ
jgi:hypothetical protein